MAHTVFKVEGFSMVRKLTYVHISWLLLMVTEKMLLRKILFMVGVVACFLLCHGVIVAEMSICGNHT